MKRPARSPSHQVAQVNESVAGATIGPGAEREAVEMLALTTLLAAQQARKAATSRGKVRVSGWRTKRRTSSAGAGLQGGREGERSGHRDDRGIVEAVRA